MRLYPCSMADYRIRVKKDYLSFSAAHFLIFGEKCERLHGHNYAVAVELEGEADENGYVFDFVELKQIAAKICDSLDHRMLLPAKNENLEFEIEGDRVSVFFGQNKFTFPKADALILPIRNATAELLADYICDQIIDELRRAGARNAKGISVEVAEAPGQSAICRKEMT